MTITTKSKTVVAREAMDSEVRVLGKITAALRPLDPDARERVLKWLLARFSTPVHSAPVLNADSAKTLSPSISSSGSGPLGSYLEERRTR
jgi:hypothetical protein